ncbi:hypothetical protein HMN09_00352900 [Mycena chlorophos]|uniref:Zn(2)-C6 fungal-type domain-containing protein n=1 Tax=Mycena chlorophos TaxID=658473 RepID=A0A8H6WI24_MYCCL|nr:hypothetical protein HMN09_00352900 [Mycena chlorophos]
MFSPFPTPQDDAHTVKKRQPTCTACRQRKMRCDGGAPCGPCSRSRTLLPCTYIPKPVGVLRTDLSKGGACLSCRRKKRKCDGTFPCITCRLSNRADSCEYDPPSPGYSPGPALGGPSAIGNYTSSNPEKVQPRSRLRAKKSHNWPPQSLELPIARTRSAPTTPQSTTSTSSLALWDAFDFNDSSRSTHAPSPSPPLESDAPEPWLEPSYSPTGNAIMNCQPTFNHSDVYSVIVAGASTRNPSYSADDDAPDWERRSVYAHSNVWDQDATWAAPSPSTWPRRRMLSRTNWPDGESAAIPLLARALPRTCMWLASARRWKSRRLSPFVYRRYRG